MTSTLFYSNLESHEEPVHELLSKTDFFQRIPNDWHIVVTDIKGSTASIDNGLSELVNLIATGSIIAALNVASKHTIDIPFFFGGDGATLLIPPALLKETMEVLLLHQENIQKEFDIHLRVGTISVSKVYQNNVELKITKAKINTLHTIPVVLGNGLHYAEKLIKSRDIVPVKSNVTQTNLDLEGMECRWDQISPPENSNEVVSLLISAIRESEQAHLFQQILEKTNEIYGPIPNRNPISVPKLKLNFEFQKIRAELKTKNKKLGIINLLKVWVSGLIGNYYFLSTDRGRKYLNDLTQLSDILVIDGRINMVISGVVEQRQQLTDYLDDLEERELIVYGAHLSEKSIMSCYVRDRSAKHIHFVDGGRSGYTRAAKVLKEKIRNKDLNL